MGKNGEDDYRYGPGQSRGNGAGQGAGQSHGGGQWKGPGGETWQGQGPGYGPGVRPGQGYGPGPGGMPGYGRGHGWGRGWRARMEGHFRSKGYRFTVPRQIILEILEENEDYVSAEDLYMQVHERHPGIGLATVYRTLQLLVEIGVVTRIETGEGKARFRLAAASERRRREVLICTNCFRTFPVSTLPDAQGALVEKIENDIQDRNKFEVRQAVLQFYGICEECARRVQKYPEQEKQ